MYNSQFRKDHAGQKIYQSLLNYYNQNNNNIDTLIPMFPYAMINAQCTFKIKYLKQYIINKAQKYKQKYLQLKNNIN